LSEQVRDSALLRVVEVPGLFNQRVRSKVPLSLHLRYTLYCSVFFLSEKFAVAAGSLEEQVISVHSVDYNPVRFNMAVP